MLRRILMGLLLSSSLALMGCAGMFGRGPEPAEVTALNLQNDGGHDWPVAVDQDASRIIRRDAAGRTVWSVPWDGDVPRPYDCVADADRVYLPHGDGVTALDRATGRVLWHSKGPARGMLLSGSLLVAADDSAAVARDAASGRECVRVAIPSVSPGEASVWFMPVPVQEADGVYLAQVGKRPGIVFDRDGRVWGQLKRQVVAAKRSGDDVVLLTDAGVECRTRNGHVRWTIPLDWPRSLSSGGFAELPDGDWVVYLYSHLSDSGVQVARLNPAAGRAVWQTWCKALGVMHSEYRQRAVVRFKGERVRVISNGGGGWFVEELAADSGKRLARRRSW